MAVAAADQGYYHGWEEQLERFLVSGDGREDVLRLLRAAHTESVHSFQFDASNHISDDDPVCLVLPAILLHPDDALKTCDDVLGRAAKKVYESLTDPVVKSQCQLKTRVHFRVSDLPNVCDLVKDKVPTNEDIGQMLSVRGTVIKATMPSMLQSAKMLACEKCGHRFVVNADFAQHHRFTKPSVCPSPEGNCRGSFFNEVCQEEASLLHNDYQEIKIQERVGNLNLGTVPRSIWVALEDDLINVCKPGDDVVVIGVVARWWQPLGKAADGRTDISLCMRANYIQVRNDRKLCLLTTKEEVEFQQFWRRHKSNPLEGRNKILLSFCPQVYGLYSVKMALAVILCGGVERIDESGTKVRGEPHMLMVGDPGTGKSQLLRYAAKLSPRSVLTNGVGSTSAGLTVSAVKDSSEWHLEAGALVLADSGVCCIDEFSLIKEADRTCIHEAMEQQSLSVAKAGLVCQLQTKCTILAASNPKGNYDPSQPLTVNTGIASPLLSRFDLVFVLLDTRNEKWDRLVSSYLLYGAVPIDETETPKQKEFIPWSLDKLRSYLTYCKKKNPGMSSEASTILTLYYKRQRQSDSLSTARTTVRLLQSALRLAQGHARLMCHDEVTVLDAVFAVLLLETSVESSGGGDSSVLHATFPKDPMEEYCSHAREILSNLGLSQLWLKEKALLDEQQLLGDLEEEDRPLTPERPIPNIIMTQVMAKIRRNGLPYGDTCAVKRPIESKQPKRNRTEGAGKGKSEKFSDSSSSDEMSRKGGKREEGSSGKTKILPKLDHTVKDFCPASSAVTSTQLNTSQKPSQSYPAREACKRKADELPSGNFTSKSFAMMSHDKESTQLHKVSSFPASTTSSFSFSASITTTFSRCRQSDTAKTVALEIETSCRSDVTSVDCGKTTVPSVTSMFEDDQDDILDFDDM